MMDTTTFIDPAVVGWINENLIFAKINGKPDNKTPTKFALDWGVRGYPTYVLIDSTGREYDREVGYLASADFIRIFDDYRQGKNTLADLLERSKSNSSAQLWFDIAYKYQWRGDSKNAEKFYQKIGEVDGVQTDSLTREAAFLVADMARRDRDWDLAIRRFATLREKYPDHEYAQVALIYQGICCRDKGATRKAIEYFTQYVTEYPEGEDVDYARDQIDDLQEDLRESEQ